MKLPSRLALLALAAMPSTASAGVWSCGDQAPCIEFTMNQKSGDSCGVGGECAVEVCMDVSSSRCDTKSGTFSHMCHQSDSNGCPLFDGSEPLMGLNGPDDQSCSSVSSLTGKDDSAAWVGKCGDGDDMIMCQEGKPGDTLYWILKDGAEGGPPNSLTVEDESIDFIVDGCTQSVSCKSHDKYCAGNANQAKLERTWAFTIPDGTGDCPSPCTADTATPEETPEWLYIACGRGKGGCGDTIDNQAEATSRHEVRCCASEKVDDGWMSNGGDTCGTIFHDSELLGLDLTSDTKTCHHTATYEEAVQICARNNASVCTKEQVDAGCVRGSGCGHDADLIWTTAEAPPRDPPPTPVEKADEDWLWLACGSPGKCGSLTDFQVQASTTHEVRCCSDFPIGGWVKNSGCDIWTESDLVGANGVPECFHDLNYADAQQLCYDNGGYICTKQQVLDGCAKGSGCSHDRDMIWTSTDAPPRVPPPFPEAKDPDAWLWLTCGRPGNCGDLNEIQVQAKEKFELRCCSDVPINGWVQQSGCDIWTESDLLIGGSDQTQCFHESTYAEAQQICYDNGGYVCSKEQVEAGCARGSGCGHDADLIWTSNDAPERPPQPGQEPRGDEEWMWLSCGRPGNCGSFDRIAAQAKEAHEVRCCSMYPVPGWAKQSGCSIWSESDLKDESGHLSCFHSSTYAEAQAVCAANGGYVCSIEEVEAGCAKGSGCGHDADLIWTSTNTTEPEPVVFPNTEVLGDDAWIWLACGRGKHECGIGIDIQIQATDTAELRCCSPLPVSGWKKNGASCDVWHESDLVGPDGREQCFHDVTYAEAQQICADNGGHVCTKEQIESGCAKGSGCGHDGDLIWTGAPAPSRTLDDLPFQDPVDEDAWLWLGCGRGQHGCGIDFDVQAQASEQHEVRCCSDYPLEGWIRKTHCSNWQQSKLVDADGNADTCFHASTYAEAQAVCRANGGYVCSKEQVDGACARGSGCGHDNDFVWTSTGPADPRPTAELPAAVPDDMNLFLACGSGEDGCDGFPVGVAKPTEKHEVRCCTPYPLNGWATGGGTCKNYHESDLLPVDAVEGTEPQCFHASTYAEAQAICHANDAYVCSVTEVLDGCARGSGCGHDNDLIWTRNEATPEAIATYNTRKTQASSISGVCIAAKGRISGDPHFTTFDQYRYDCQGTGEFVIAMSKGSDPLAIHGRFVRTVDSRIKPTITKAVAIKVVDAVPTIQVQAPPQKTNGKCPLTYTIGEDETPIDDIVAYVNENFNGTASAFSNGRNIIFTFEDVKARIQISGGGGGNRCVLNTNLCLTPESHGGAENIVGLLGSPDGNKDNDWMNRDGSTKPHPEICDIENPTSSEKKHCKTQKNIQGHEWCMDNWCIGHPDNSLWSEQTHTEFNQCDNREPDEFFNNVEEADPAIVEACEDAEIEDTDGCVIDTIICVENGGTIDECVALLLEDDEDNNIVDNLGTKDPSNQLEGWDGPVSHTEAVTLEEEIVLEVPDTPPPGDCPVCKAKGWGDPHIVTFDGLTYDVHVKGELTFLKSTDPANDFTIQARTVAVKDHPRGPAVTSAVVVHKTGEPTIQVSLGKDASSELAKTFNVNGNSCEVQLYVDGVARDVGTGSGLTDGSATVQVRGNRIVVEYINLQMRLDMSVRSWRNECHFSVTYYLRDCPCDGDLVGILGQPGGSWTNDWHEHDGTPVDIPRSRRKRRGKEAYDYSLTWCLEADDSHFEYEPNMSHADFDKCSGTKGDDNYDVDVDKIIEEAEPEIIDKCTTDGELDEGCVIECVYLGEGACDEYKDIVEETQTADIPETPDDTPDSTPDDTPDDTPDSTPDDTPDSTPDDTPDTPLDDAPDGGDGGGGGGGGDDTSPTEGQEVPCTTFAPDGSCVTDSSGSLGDPHFKTWAGEHYEYHGQCDLLLAKDKNFADGLGFEVQIRTKLVRFWSYIKRAAIRIGDDILEVEGVADIEADKTNHFWVNFDYAPTNVKTIGGFPISIVNNKAKKRVFEIDLSSKFPGQKIVVSTFREFVRVDFKQTTAEAFGNAVGMMGDYKTGSLFARDGVREIDDFLELGNEWQLLPSDDMLFHDKGEPQFPKRCLVPEDPQGQRRRRLGESTVTVEEAEAACAKAGTALDIKDCVYDILATQDLDMAGAF